MAINPGGPPMKGAGGSCLQLSRIAKKQQQFAGKKTLFEQVERGGPRKPKIIERFPLGAPPASWDHDSRRKSGGDR